jgi:hypothetical protein
MSKNNPAPGGHAKKLTPISLVRSSAAEYLTFVAAGGNSEASVEMRYEDENIWLTQKMMAALYDVSVPAINQHLKRIFSDNELEESSVVKQYLTTAADGKGYKQQQPSVSLKRSKTRCTNATLSCFEELCYAVGHGSLLAPGEVAAALP